MSDLDEYERRAAEAEERASGTHDSDIKRQWLELAEQWRTMAWQRHRHRD